MSEVASFSISVFAMLLYISLIAGSISLYLYLRKWRTERRKRQRIHTFLQGEHLDAFLKRSPFQIGHVQGENGYRITDSRNDQAIVYFANSTLDAQLWIMEQEANSD